ncbi:N-acetylglucosamine kinase-like BadF-type ATPase [Actinoplanes tereljensis]|uniref:N-acetylglucosamine kinase n=1 Tax=Paractinoplanes tereljensis TaxID=571912 RepID=A0A919TTL4_9ACTN|nr:BadF/BadG/BcrA/BcrD ATPase family protein [Actinoplanes tereljensis]GIF22668.1 N-acetylglucosamine kinase [Actinoplanes tereljensis]
MDLVVGVDAGGTASRAVVATVDGSVVGRGVAGPGNPLSGGVSAASAVGAALVDALSGCDPSLVAGGVLGLAGTSAVADPVIAGAFDAMWRSLGLNCPMRIVGDVVTAFAAGTPAPSGAVLIAGTGAVAARIVDHAVVAVADGFGWLLGDEGSGRWMGLQALRSAVRDWPSTLALLVAAHARVTSADALIRWAQALPFAAIDDLAPVVCNAARNGDASAGLIVSEAATRLLATLDQVVAAAPTGPPSPVSARPSPALASPASAPALTRPSLPASAPTPTRPVVLAGGLLAGDTPVREAVAETLRKRGTTVGTSRDPAAAAAWLAARPLSGSGAPALHAALLG